MKEVKFEEERIDPFPQVNASKPRGFSGALVSLGIASDVGAANFLMVIFGIALLIFSGIIFKSLSSNDPARLIPHPPAPYSQGL